MRVSADVRMYPVCVCVCVYVCILCVRVRASMLASLVAVLSVSKHDNMSGEILYHVETRSTLDLVHSC